MTVLPEDFLSATPPPRMIGIECENNLQTANKQPSEYVTQEILAKADIKSHDRFLGNGGKLYIDLGNLEYDTPECPGPRQAAIHERAGVLVMQDIIAASDYDHRGLYRNSGSSIQDSNGNTTTMTSGTHKNFLVPRSVTETELFDRFLPGHLATRMYAMGGKVGEQGYEFSQKIAGIGGLAIIHRVERRTDYGNKPMAMVPPAFNDLDTIGNAKMARLEVRLADPIMSPLGAFLDVATTSLVLRLLEHPELISKQLLSTIELANPVEAGKLFSKDLSWKATADTTSGQQATFISIQRAYAEAAASLSDHVALPEDELLAIDLWLAFCDKAALAKPLDAEYGTLIHEYDFAARHYYLVRKLGARALASDNPVAVQRSLGWDRIYPIGGSLMYWARQPNPIYTNEAVIAAKSQPPKSRAMIRADIINSGDPNKWVHSWSNVTTRPGRTVKLSDAYMTHLSAA
jgi:proteasome accessory factor A